MKIKVGISDLSEAKYFIDNGAGEIYFGINDVPSHSPSVSIKNTSLDEIKKTVDYAHNKNCGVYVAVNDINTNTNPVITKKMFYVFESTNIDGFIVSSIEIIKNYPVSVKPPKWHLSTLGMCFNSFNLQFYKRYGISRYCIPQQLLPRESEYIFSQNPKIESEVFFILNEMCVNLDGICKGCFGNCKTQAKFCDDVLNIAGKKYSCGGFSVDEKLDYFYKYCKKADYLKLVRFGAYEHRKKVFSVAGKLLLLAKQADNEQQFIERAKTIVNRELL